jgi:hypothetical protein
MLVFFYAGELLATPPNPQPEVPPIVGCLQLFSQYIRSYSPYLKAFFSILNKLGLQINK